MPPLGPRQTRVGHDARGRLHREGEVGTRRGGGRADRADRGGYFEAGCAPGSPRVHCPGRLARGFGARDRGERCSSGGASGCAVWFLRSCERLGDGAVSPWKEVKARAWMFQGVGGAARPPAQPGSRSFRLDHLAKVSPTERGMRVLRGGDGRERQRSAMCQGPEGARKGSGRGGSAGTEGRCRGETARRYPT